MGEGGRPSTSSAASIASRLTAMGYSNISSPSRDAGHFPTPRNGHFPTPRFGHFPTPKNGHFSTQLRKIND
jgi:hypothetical protein